MPSHLHLPSAGRPRAAARRHLGVAARVPAVVLQEESAPKSAGAHFLLSHPRTDARCMHTHTHTHTHTNTHTHTHESIMTWSEGTADGERLAVPRTDGVTLRMRRRTRVTLASVRSLCECAPKKGRPSVALQAKLLLKHEWIVKAVAHVDHKKNEKALKASPDWPELFGVPIGERRVAPCSGCGCVTPCDSFSRATWMWDRRTSRGARSSRARSKSTRRRTTRGRSAFLPLPFSAAPARARAPALPEPDEASAQHGPPHPSTAPACAQHACACKHA